MERQKITPITIQEFIKWVIQNEKKPKTSPHGLTKEETNNLYKFIMFYKKQQKQYQKETEKINKQLESETYQEIKQAMQEFTRLNKDGKYLRAMLVALGYKATEKKDKKYIPLAVAIEIFQTAILIHDDIIDNATKRRGKNTIPVSYQEKYSTPKINKPNFQAKKQTFSNSMGICIGDLGFYIANKIIIENYKENLPAILEYYNNMVIKTCKGELLDIILPFKEEYFETDPNLEEKITQIYTLKTAWYSIIGPYCLGMILGNAKKDKIDKMQHILLNIGIAYQIQDDLLGIYGDETSIGKSTTSDPEEYKQTILYSYTIKTKYKNELQKYYGKKLNQKQTTKIQTIFEKSGAKKYAENKKNELFETSQKQIEKLNYLNEQDKQLLKGLIIYLKNRTK